MKLQYAELHFKTLIMCYEHSEKCQILLDVLVIYIITILYIMLVTVKHFNHTRIVHKDVFYIVQGILHFIAVNSKAITNTCSYRADHLLILMLAE